MDKLVPGLADLVESSSLRLLALIWVQGKKSQHYRIYNASQCCTVIYPIQLFVLEPTNGVALPTPTTLSKAGAVHQISLLVELGEGLVHLVGQAVYNTLV